MTAETIKKLELGIDSSDSKTKLLVESALNWVLDNTTLSFDCNKDDDLIKLPAPVKLFILSFIDIMGNNPTVASESIEGLSQSYKQTDKNLLLWDSAEQLLGKWLHSRVQVFSAKTRWK